MNKVFRERRLRQMNSTPLEHPNNNGKNGTSEPKTCSDKVSDDKSVEKNVSLI